MSPIDRTAVRRAFGRAAARYDQHAQLQAQIGAILLERLDDLRVEPGRVLDVGAGTGRASAALRARWPKAQVIAVDFALPMLRAARRRAGWWRPFQRVAAEASALPFADASVAMLHSNLCIQWVDDLPALFDEWRRVLAPGGLLLVSSFGPETLLELREAWSQVDGHPHVSRFADIAQLGDAIFRAGFRDPVLDREHFTLGYPDARAAMRALKAIGASNADARRARGLTAPARLARVEAAYERARRADGTLPLRYEAIFAHAFAPPAGAVRRERDDALASFPVESLRGSRIRRPPG